MELFSAGNLSQMDVIKRWIDESDVYMLILCGRYGSVEPSTGVSYTELEYDYALQQNKPIFSVVIKEEVLNERVKEQGLSIVETIYANELKQFRSKVLSLMCAFFGDVKDIKLSIYESMSEYKNDVKLTGWVPSSQFKEASLLTDEIERLINENNELKSSLKELTENKDNNHEADFNYDHLFELLKSIHVNLPSDIKSEYNLSMTDLFSVSYKFLDELTVGVTNRALNSTALTKFLYFNVTPKLQLHGLATTEAVPDAQFRRASLTAKGLNFFALYEVKRNLAASKNT